MAESSFFLDANVVMGLAREYARLKTNPATITAEKEARARISEVLSFAEFVRKRPQEWTREDVDRFKVHLEDRGYAKSTRSKKMSIVSQFSEYLQEEGIIGFNPVPRGKWRDDIRPKPYSSERVRALTREEAKQFLGAIDRETPRGARLYAQCVVILHTGMRPSEVCRILWRECDLEGEPPTVRTKVRGGEFVTFELTEEAKDAINEYLMIAERYPRPDDALFAPVTKRKKQGKPYQPLHPYSLRKHIKRVSQNVGLDVTPDTLRHTFAELYHESGASQREMQAALGHQSEAATKMYLEALGLRSAKAGKAVQAMLRARKNDLRGGGQSQKPE